MLIKPVAAGPDLIDPGGRSLQTLQIALQVQAQFSAANQQALLAQLQFIGAHLALLM